MKKLFACALVLILALALCAAASAEGDWYELSAEDSVLTVRLPANPSTGYQWEDFISDGTVLEMITSEYVQDEASEGMVGVGGTYIASYRGLSEGTTVLSLGYYGPGAEEPDDEFVLLVNVDAEGKIGVDTAITDEPSSDEWMDLDQENNVVIANLPANTADGYFWTSEVSDPEVLELVAEGYDEPDTEKCAENVYSASFRLIGASEEEQVIHFGYGPLDEEGSVLPVEVRVASLYINEEGQLEIAGLETITYEVSLAE